MWPPIVTYSHHVFLSYPWKDKFGQREAVAKWVEEFFYPAFYAELNELIPATPQIFSEATSPDPGMMVPQKLSQLLRGSCVLVAVLGLPYFRKPWCAAEWRTFRVPGMDPTASLGRPRYIVPVIYGADPKQFPIHAQVDSYDFSKFRTIRSPTKAFQDQVGKVAAKVKSLITESSKQPPDQSWPFFTDTDMLGLAPEQAAQWMIVQQGDISFPGWAA